MNNVKCLRPYPIYCSTCTITHSHFIHNINLYKEGDGKKMKVIITCGKCCSLIYQNSSWTKFTSSKTLVEELNLSQRFETDSGNKSKIFIS
jgi:hypothetical protein